MNALAVVLLFASFLTDQPAVDAAQRHLDKSKQFTYELPAGWQVVDNPQAAHDVIVLRGEDGRNRNITIADQPGKSELPLLKTKYERDLPKSLKGFKLIASEIVDLNGRKGAAGNRPAIRIIHTNTSPGAPVRQVNYIFELDGHRYFVAGTVVVEDGANYDDAFKRFVEKMSATEKKADDAKPGSGP